MLYVVGDIHGMKDALVRLLAKLPLEPGDEIVFIGDYVDRGPNPRGCVDVLLRLRERHDCTFLLGNHESMFLSFLGWTGPGYFAGEAFLANGGETTLASYGYFDSQESFQLPTGHADFFRACKLWYLRGQYLFVHAGLSRDALPLADPKYALSREQPRELLWERSTMDLPHSLGVTIIYGHTPSPDYQLRWNLPYSVGIDTGCVFGGPLTALRLPDETIFQV
ncbi:MAG: metallophosphoesterase family protein [Myxococcota bacterium]